MITISSKLFVERERKRREGGEQDGEDGREGGNYHNSHFNKQKPYCISSNMKVTLNIVRIVLIICIKVTIL